MREVQNSQEESEVSGQERRRFPRVMIAAEKSGQGKTMITCALLSMLSDMGKEVRAFKCGPDYIDPMFHRRVLGIPSRNLDSFFADSNTLRYLMGRDGGEENGIGIVEGVMGYYDGLGGTTDRASSYEIAKMTETPVILIADGSGRSLSALAALKGFLTYREDSGIRGVIFNRISPMQYPGLKALAEKEFGVSVIGYVPVLSGFSLESRHLGLIMPDEIPKFCEKVRVLAEQIRPGIDLEALFALADEAKALTWSPFSVPLVRKADGSAPVIAVAMDEAFCFYYPDNLEALERMGAELNFFSPIRDAGLPGEADGLYLGGGYPELHARALSENVSMRESVRSGILQGIPCIAECGGYLYLKSRLWDPEGISWPMAGVLPGESADAGKLKRFGYVTMTAKQDGILGGIGTRFPAHEFHHWDSKENGAAFFAEKPVGNRGWDCGFLTKTLYAGFPHLYFYGHLPYRFLKRAAEYKDSREGRRRGQKNVSYQDGREGKQTEP